MTSALSYIGSLGVRVGLPTNRTNISMQVPDVNGLVAGSNVLFRGVPIGKVQRVKASPVGATVDFYLDSAYQIPIDSQVRLDNLSALGETYIGITPRVESGPVLRDGQQLATEAVTLPPSISELATNLVHLLNQLDRDQLNRILEVADTALPDVNAVLPNLSRASLLLKSTITSMPGSGQQVLSNFQSLLRNADFVGPALASITPHLALLGPRFKALIAAAVLAIDHADAPRSLEKMGDYLNRIQGLLDDRGGDIKILAEPMLPQMQAIAGAVMNIDISQILTNMLDAVPDDGAITLHVRVPPN
ncbi:MlaD family protein [Mycobacteroides abscessus]|uniref:MlaD family protein n=1 Tax=Mycobacteroides abscessus TaxID=36809 RepID=UPI001F405A44|nr:MlaD family protein [Mycobacteroides abscessus]